MAVETSASVVPIALGQLVVRVAERHGRLRPVSAEHLSHDAATGLLVEKFREDENPEAAEKGRVRHRSLRREATGKRPGGSSPRRAALGRGR